MKNKHRQINLYTQGLQFAARVVLIVGLLFGCLESLLATPKDQGALDVVSPATLVLDQTVWEQYFGAVGENPALPADITEILSSPCPFWEGKQVKDTHLLVLIPSHVAGQPLTLDYLGELIQSPQGGGHGTQYRYYVDAAREAIGSQASGSSYWVLMTRDVLPESCNKSYADQCALVEHHQGYTSPGALEALVVMLLHHVRSGERLYSDHPLTYTRCRKKVHNCQLIVGGFSSGGPLVGYSFASSGFIYGVAGLRKL